MASSIKRHKRKAKGQLKLKRNLSHLMRKPTNWHVHPAKTQISLGIRPVRSESSLSAWRKLGSLATHWAHTKESDQTGRMPRLIWVFAGRTCHFVDFCHEAAHFIDVYTEWYVQESHLFQYIPLFTHLYLLAGLFWIDYRENTFKISIHDNKLWNYVNSLKNNRLLSAILLLIRLKKKWYWKTIFSIVKPFDHEKILNTIVFSNRLTTI